ncbi:MAG: anion permease [Lachnospiraceae bacterium]|nr:anion permease [Candidatus Merdinaster equi]
MAKLKETKYLKYIINLVIAAVILLAIVYMPFDIGLGKEAVNYLAILAAMVFMLISGVFDEHVVILATLAMCVLLKVASFSTIFSAYSGTTMWMVLSILPITVVIQKSGLMNRIALLLLKLFPASYKWQLFSLALSSMVVSPLIPSTTAKSSLLASLTASVAEKMKLEKQSKPFTAIFLAVFINGPSMGHIFLSGSVQALLVVGMMPEDMAVNFSWIGWLAAASVWAVVGFILIYVLLLLLYKPEKPVSLSKEEIDQMLRDQGKMTGTEKLTSVLMILTLAGWITKSFTGIPECVFAIVTYAVLFTVGAITKQEFRSKVPWDVWIYVGGIVCVANLFTTLGIDSWLAGVMEPLVRILTCNEFVYIAALVIIVYVSRIFIVSSIAAVTIFYVVFASTAYQLLGINPFITGFLIIGASKSWPTEYTNTNYVTAEAIVGKDCVKFKDAQLMSHLYIVVTIVAAYISIPFWKMTGLM